MSRQRPQRRSRQRPGMRLTDRDKAILELIHNCEGLLSLRQIDRVFFSGRGRTQPRARMRTLFANGYVNMPDASHIHQVPMGETIYWLNKKGAAVVAAMYGVPLEDFSWRREPRWSWLPHDLAVIDFRLRIMQACQALTEATLRLWVPETDFLANPDTIEFTDKDQEQRKRQVRPDGFFLIAWQREGDAEPDGFAFLLEVDMATHSNPSFARNKARAGLAYLRSDAYQRRFGLRFGRWLVVTTSEQRLLHLRRQIELAGGGHLFYLTTFEQVAAMAAISPAAVLSQPYWQVAGSRELTSLIPNDKVEST